MEELVVEFVGFVQVLLLHLVADVTVFTVGRFIPLVISESLNKQTSEHLHDFGNNS